MSPCRPESGGRFRSATSAESKVAPRFPWAGLPDRIIMMVLDRHEIGRSWKSVRRNGSDTCQEGSNAGGECTSSGCTRKAVD